MLSCIIFLLILALMTNTTIFRLILGIIIFNFYSCVGSKKCQIITMDDIIKNTDKELNQVRQTYYDTSNVQINLNNIK